MHNHPARGVAGGSRPYKCYKLIRQHHRLLRWAVLSPPTSRNILAKALGVSAGLLKQARKLVGTIPPHAWVEAEHGDWRSVEEIIFRSYPGFRLLPGYRRCMAEIEAVASTDAPAQAREEAPDFRSQNSEEIDVATRRAQLGELLEAWLTPAAIASLLKLGGATESGTAFDSDARPSSLPFTDSNHWERIERVLPHVLGIVPEASAAIRWLRKPAAPLRDARPLDLLTSDGGEREVLAYIKGIGAGNFQ